MGTRHRKRQRPARAITGGQSKTLLSVNGQLQDMHKDATTASHRSSGYTAVEIGKPLVVQYLHLFLRHLDFEQKNELMVSTFLKTDEAKIAAAESVNLFDTEAVFNDGTLRVSDFGGEKYGHPLIYYTKSYRGESLRLTTKIMELDSVGKHVKKAIREGISELSSLYVFAEYLPFMSAAMPGANLVMKLISVFNRDDNIVRSHDLDLYFDTMHTRRLQSGRIVCLSPSEIDKEQLAADYKLRKDNVLVAKTGGEEYTGSSYFVIQVDSRKNQDLEDFEHFVGAADLLAETNRGGSGTDLVKEVVSLARDAADVAAIRDMEALALEAQDGKSKAIVAIFKSLSPELQKAYGPRKDEIVGNEEG